MGSSASFAIRDLVNGDGSVSVSDYGAHVLRWAPQGQPDVVWRPKTVYLKEGKAIRGGIPVIFPWFNSGFDPDSPAAKTPKHGFARSSFWHPDDGSLTDRHARYTLDSGEIDDATLAQFVGNDAPRFHAAYEVTAGRELTVELTVTNDGDRPFSYEAALHTYLKVGDVTRARVEGLDGSEYLDTTRDGFPVCVQSGPVAFDGGMVDRIYLANGTLELHDDMLGRTVAVSSRGATATVVWNPVETAGNAIGDLDEGEWRGFVCVEAAANRERMITLAPGESHTLGQTLAVKA
ncbi:D-hexose-6-phosphate mutarotase [Bifidobacterium platyrrhinorum]|uniref:Putative glucose-6-phosphate 1-epimerase n=1 Tax=Bifidobacterium platyrrhinorum TaxID=2661628 RepID=A0A6L9SQK4_9BIFI|nr:D-hexose-6-phosphate mutarotase [Bifidobacterium platyrrhinorum]NEG54800.1 D-hexose-6-phosphate mutarotase [Bifidobacterium platyrrhinorum]